MSKNGFGGKISNSRFFTINIILLAFLLGITVVATFNGTLWAIGAALITSLVIIPFIYIEVRVNHKFMVRLVIGAVFILITMFLVSYLGEPWTPYPLYAIAIIEYSFAVFLFACVVGLLCWRYLRPKFESNQVIAERSQSI